MKDSFGSSGHRERLREKYLQLGHDAFQDYEKLELLLTFAIPRCDVKPVAKRLLEQCGGLSGVVLAPADELRKIEGVGPAAAMLITLMRGICTDALFRKITGKPVMSCSADVIRYARLKLGPVEKEVFMVVYVNVRNEITGVEIIAEGTIDRLVVHPREVFAGAVRHNARSLILIHNHPGGTPKPSPEDIVLTEALNKIASALNLELLDHLVITHNSAYSITLQQMIEVGTEQSWDIFNTGSIFPADMMPEEMAGENTTDYDKLPFHAGKIRSVGKTSMTKLTQHRKRPKS